MGKLEPLLGLEGDSLSCIQDLEKVEEKITMNIKSIFKKSYSSNESKFKMETKYLLICIDNF